MDLTKDSLIKMNDGHRIPVLGFGTYAPAEVPKSQAKEGTKLAIDAGFRHIDAAFLYQNEVEVGEAIREKIADGTVKREDIFYTGKVFPREQRFAASCNCVTQFQQAAYRKHFSYTWKPELWSTFNSPELVRPCLMKSLKALQLDYIDLYLIHSPISFKPGEDLYPVDENGKLLCIDVDLRATWEVLEAFKDEGLVRSIGLSNFSIEQLEMILNKPGLKHKPVCNQVECHVYMYQKKLLEFCKSKDIVLVAYNVLGSSRDKKWIDQNSPVLLEDPVLLKIGQKYKKSSAQVAMRYQLQRGIVVLAKSFTPERIKQNLQVFDFHLTPEDMKILDGLNRNMSFLKIEVLDEKHRHLMFHDEYQEAE